MYLSIEYIFQVFLQCVGVASCRSDAVLCLFTFARSHLSGAHFEFRLCYRDEHFLRKFSYHAQIFMYQNSCCCSCSKIQSDSYHQKLKISHIFLIVFWDTDHISCFLILQPYFVDVHKIVEHNRKFTEAIIAQREQLEVCQRLH